MFITIEELTELHMKYILQLVEKILKEKGEEYLGLTPGLSYMYDHEWSLDILIHDFENRINTESQLVKLFFEVKNETEKVVTDFLNDNSVGNGLDFYKNGEY